jgi:transcriptional regulator with XRE-family HTH domain
MRSQKLPHYLRTYRKRAGLSQDELAWLLGCQSGSKVSRYESFSREPSLKTILAYEIVFRVPARELFGGIFDAVEMTTRRRVESLIKRLNATESNRSTVAKLLALRAITRSRIAKRHTGEHA